uniref:FLYWCH-type domain-containing protein n=1 Tax=Meloidogyne hapla TaxID=6305 RepID=A0A1I8BBZ2_MELHA
MDPFHHSSSGFIPNPHQNDEHENSILNSFWSNDEEIANFDLSKFMQNNYPEPFVQTHAGQSSGNHELSENYPYYQFPDHLTAPINSHAFHAGQSSQGNHELSETNVLPHPFQITSTNDYKCFHYNALGNKKNVNIEYYRCSRKNGKYTCKGKIDYLTGFEIVEKFKKLKNDHTCAATTRNHQINTKLCVEPMKESQNFTSYCISMEYIDVNGHNVNFYGAQSVGENCIDLYIPIGIPLQFKVTWFELNGDIEP